MELNKTTYNILLSIFIILIITLFILLFLYNESRLDMVEKAQSKGYICEKNWAGFYKECYSPNYLKQMGKGLTNITFNNSIIIQK